MVNHIDYGRMYMALDLRQDIFQPVVARIAKRTDSLTNIMRFANSGIEEWFKVEIVAALGDKVDKLQNIGTDLKLQDGTEVEIKAATNFSKDWCITQPVQKYGQPVLFLAGGASPEKLQRVRDDSFEIVACDGFSAGIQHWLIGMVKPRA